MTDPKGTWSDGGKVWEGEPATPAVDAVQGALELYLNAVQPFDGRAQINISLDELNALRRLAATPAVGGDIATIRQYVKNARGAIESGQVTDKDVHGTLTKVIAMLDALTASNLRSGLHRREGDEK